MERRQLSYQLLVSIIIVCCYQQIWAERLVKETGAEYINSSNKDTNQTTKQPKLIYIKTTTPTASTTTNPEVATTMLPSEFDLDGRSVFINNEFVADAEEPARYASSHLLDLLQQQIQTALSNTSGHIQDNNSNSPLLKENVETQKLPAKPIFEPYDEYEEEEYGFDSDCITGNCEDNHASAGDDDIARGLVVQNGLTHEYENVNSSDPYIFQQSFKNKPYHSSNYGPQRASYVNKQNKPKESIIYGYEIPEPAKQQNDNKNNDANNPTSISKPVNQQNTQNYYGQMKPKKQPQLQLPPDQYVQSKPLQHYGPTNQNPFANSVSYDKPKSQLNQKPPNIIRITSQNLLNSQKPTENDESYTKQPIKISVNKSGESSNNKPLYSSNYTNIDIFSTLSSDSYKNMELLSSSKGNFNANMTSSIAPFTFNNLNPSIMPNFSYGNTQSGASSPFSTTVEHNKNFRPVSSSTQYVSTPFADLVFKYTISMAKHLNSKVGNHFADNQAQIVNTQNDIDAKAE